MSNTKFCKRCKKDKVLSDFITKKEYVWCNECREKKRNYHKNNIDVGKRGYQKYISKEENRIKRNEYNKKRRQKKEYKINFNIYRKEYRKKDYVKERRNEYRRNRKKNDLEYKLKSDLRSRISSFIQHKNISTDKSLTENIEKIIKCQKKHLLNWFEYNIDIDNLNEYHIDHVRPLSKFKINEYEDIIKSNCNHWMNLLPVEPQYNLSKNNRNPTQKELFKLDLRIYVFCKKNNIKYEKIIFNNYI